MCMHIFRQMLVALAIASALALSGCGGGGSSDGTMPQPPGTLDPSFGNGGVVTTSNAGGNGVALQPDGKILVAAGNAVIRYDPDGMLDATFGTAGLVSGVLASGTFGSSGITVQPDGKIVAAGSFIRTDGGGAYHCALMRYMIDGAIDPGFGNGGLVVWEPDGDVSNCRGVAIQPDQSIVLGVSRGSYLLTPGATVRFRPDGSLDPSFGVGGTAPNGGTIAIQPDGKILAAQPLFGHGVMQCNLVRLDTGGVLDPEFGVGGRVEWKGPFDDQAPLACALALQPDGKIVVVNLGSVTRYLDNGTVDPAFGVGGITTGIPGEAVAVQSNGKIVVVGGAGNTAPPTGFALWRLDANGRLDSGFGNAGTTTTLILDIGGAQSLAIQPDGRIVAAGWAESTTPAGGGTPSQVAAVARYFGD